MMTCTRSHGGVFSKDSPSYCLVLPCKASKNIIDKCHPEKKHITILKYTFVYGELNN